MEQTLKFLSERPNIFAIDIEKGPGESFIISMWSKDSSIKARRSFSSQEMAEALDADAFIFSIFEQLYSMIKDKERELADYYNMSRVHSVIREKEQKANDHN